MINRNKPVLILATALLPLLAACVAQPQQEKAQDSRLDLVVSQLDKSLANQASATAQLQAQQRQLEKQEQNLLALNTRLKQALSEDEVKECPETVACPAVPETYSKMLVGGLEQVWFPELGLALTARIDTGVATASLDAQDIEEFERDGKPWVRFSIANPETGQPEVLERRLVRTIGIQKVGSDKLTRRPVVKMGIAIGQNEQTAEFGLSNRKHSTYQVKIGRSILKDVMVVDVSKKNIAPYPTAEKTPVSTGDKE
ncbi:MAG: ATP-dependent zinc protease [Halioglobus sp.]|nr:ATP-dependent zinc protease [Halioglobus sp.]